MKKLLHLIVALLLLITLSASVFGSQEAYASPQSAPQVRWEAAVRLRPEVIPLVTEEQRALIDSLSKSGVSARADGDWALLQGQKDLAQLNATLFDAAASWLDFLGGPVELTISLPSNGGSLTLNLEARNTTGYVWEVLPETVDYLQSGNEFAMRYFALGAPAIQTIRLTATRTGMTSLRLLYHRPFEPAYEQHARLNIWFSEAMETIDLSDPTPAVLAEDEMFSQPEDPDAYAELDQMTTALPSSWDWRTQGIVPPVRDQGSCGSCWAFGTVGMMESAVKKGGGPLTDLSEQFLVSCNNDGWSCNGGRNATKYHYNVLGLNQTAPGAVLEVDKPYTATDGTCPTAYNHPYRASGWAFIVPSEWSLPTVDEIKNAIYTYGPAAAAVCVDNGWFSYSGGVYVPTGNSCNGWVNHLIVLVGWDDATSSWILRNSWGEYWGENGYMRIRWDTTGTTSRVGTGTSWVTYVGTPPTVPVLISPGGVLSDTTPTFTWKSVDGATQYRFEVYQGTTLKYAKTVSASVCGAVNCKATPTNVLNYTTYKWRAQAYVGDAWQEFSAYKSFKISPVPILVSPAGTITSKTPTFKWKKVDGATQYQFQVWRGTTLLYTKQVPSSACGAAYCTNTPTTQLTFGTYKWRAQAMVGGIWRDYSTYKSFTLASPKPQAGFWASNTGDEFYVTADQMNVADFAIYITVPYCGSYKITHIPLVPIVNKQFSFSGSFYASGTFDTTTSSHGQDGLRSFYIPGCGTVSGGPWSWTATWRHASPPPGEENLDVIIEPILQGFDFIAHIVKVVSP